MSRKIAQDRNGSGFRPAVRLGAELEKSLSAYATAALAAGVGIAAFTGSAEAKIVYTPANVPIAANGGPVVLDLNHDGKTDFILSNIFRPPSSSISSAILLVDVSDRMRRNQVWGRGTGTNYGLGRYASALFGGVSVGPNKLQLHRSPTALMARLLVQFFPEVPGRARPALFSSTCSNASFGCDSATQGQWMYTKNRYLGLQFEVSGKLHYGWARFKVSRVPMERYNNTINTATLTGYAYETVPNKPIITGRTKGPEVVTVPEDVRQHSLGALAAGRSVISH